MLWMPIGIMVASASVASFLFGLWVGGRKDREAVELLKATFDRSTAEIEESCRGLVDVYKERAEFWKAEAEQAELEAR